MAVKPGPTDLVRPGWAVSRTTQVVGRMAARVMVLSAGPPAPHLVRPERRESTDGQDLRTKPAGVRRRPSPTGNTDDSRGARTPDGSRTAGRRRRRHAPGA